MVEHSQKLKPVGRVSVIGACLFALLLIVGMEVQKHREETRAPIPPSYPISPQLPEARLAAIQLGQLPLSSDPIVPRLAWLLDLLAADCTANTRRDLADLAVNSLQELRNSGISAAPTQVLGGVAGLEDIGRRSGCKPYFDRYVATRRESPATPG
jgi:hypothetical protein